MELRCDPSPISEDLFCATAVDVLPGGVASASFPQLRLLQVNGGLARLTGYACPADLLEAAGGVLQGVIWPPDWGCVHAAMDRFLPLNGKVRVECRLRTREGCPVWVTLCAGLIQEPDGASALACFFLDLTDLRRAEAELAERCRILTEKTRRETMTGLLTKDAFREDVKCWLEGAGPSACYALMVIDLDDFKHINDRFGHTFGDRVLQSFSTILTDSFGPCALCGCYGGDEFVVFLRDTPADQVPGALKEFYCRLRCRRRGDLPFQCSIGAVSAKGPVNYGLLFDRADTALYDAKRKGKNRFEAVAMS